MLDRAQADTLDTLLQRPDLGVVADARAIRFDPALPWPFQVEAAGTVILGPQAGAPGGAVFLRQALELAWLREAAPDLDPAAAIL
ncbi:hypothetical protein HUK82_09870, partial [Ameyamaea chiangmaiensis]|nr:hypothetical protein [Ameyamaea chiangmaiensis]